MADLFPWRQLQTFVLVVALLPSIATIAGTLPLALEIGAGSEVRQPVGIAIMGGFISYSKGLKKLER
ncbi:efflux RND transporter permease subunit [Nostoc sp. UHCC 0252]|nr:efflux RND transporter permease subunit [Nostoc sp. UHCC 0252]MEA5599567.1 efflux RND transporter permease subunit [Nostoc sp. UHCC 0252]